MGRDRYYLRCKKSSYVFCKNSIILSEILNFVRLSERSLISISGKRQEDDITKKITLLFFY